MSAKVAGNIITASASNPFILSSSMERDVRKIIGTFSLSTRISFARVTTYEETSHQEYINGKAPD